jgi:hypothetical protein
VGGVFFLVICFWFCLVSLDFVLGLVFVVVVVVVVVVFFFLVFFSSSSLTFQASPF